MLHNLLAGTGPNLDSAVSPVWAVIGVIIPVVLSVVSLFGVFKCISLGIAYSKSDENGTHEKAKKDLINAIVGYGIIFVLTVVLWLAYTPLVEWLSSLTNGFKFEPVNT